MNVMLSEAPHRRLYCVETNLGATVSLAVRETSDN